MKIFIGTLGTISLLLLATCILLNVALALVFVFRNNENKKADYFFALMLLVFGFTSIHHVLLLQKIYQEQPSFNFLPIYFTLSLGGSMFYAVKLRLFPTYDFKGSDLKHLVLPIGQFLYFIILFFFTSAAFRIEWGRQLFSPFYGGFEMALYIGTFYIYLYGAYRYVHFKIASLRKNKEGGRPLYEAFVLRRMLRIMSVLFWVNSAYIVTDFAMYELLQLNMHNFRGFTRFGDLSFAAMAGWVGLTGIQLLIRLPYLNTSKLAFSLFKRLLRFAKKN